MTPAPLDHPRTRRTRDLTHIADLLPGYIERMERRGEAGGEDPLDPSEGVLARATGADGRRPLEGCP